MSHFIGYHATGKRHRASLEKGLKAVESGWDPNSGGELGPGFYVTKDYPTACLYGAGAAQEANDGSVDVWKVECSSALNELKSLDVPAKFQFEKIPQAFCTAPYHWLYNAAEKPPIQIKFNNWCLDTLSISLYKTMTTNEAFEAKHEDAI